MPLLHSGGGGRKLAVLVKAVCLSLSLSLSLSLWLSLYALLGIGGVLRVVYENIVYATHKA